MNYDQMFPGRFAKAGMFEGKDVTLTIDTVYMERLDGDDGDASPIVRFKESSKGTDKQIEVVINKTNVRCIMAMFGDESDNWSGKRVTLFPEKDTSGMSDSGFCIRVKGSPDIKKAVDAIIPATRFRKAVTRKMVNTGKNKAADAGSFDSSQPLPGDPTDLGI